MKVQVEFCKHVIKLVSFWEWRRRGRKNHLPGTEKLTEREKCRMQRLRPAIATGRSKLEHLQGSAKIHTFVTFLQWQTWFPQAASHDPLALAEYFMWRSGKSAVIHQHLKTDFENMHQKCQLWVYSRNETAYLATPPAPPPTLHLTSSTPLIKSACRAGIKRGHRSRTAPSNVVIGPSRARFQARVAHGLRHRASLSGLVIAWTKTWWKWIMGLNFTTIGTYTK